MGNRRGSARQNDGCFLVAAAPVDVFHVRRGHVVFFIHGLHMFCHVQLAMHILMPDVRVPTHVSGPVHVREHVVIIFRTVTSVHVMVRHS